MGLVPDVSTPHAKVACASGHRSVGSLDQIGYTSSVVTAEESLYWLAENLLQKDLHWNTNLTSRSSSIDFSFKGAPSSESLSLRFQDRMWSPHLITTPVRLRLAPGARLASPNSHRESSKQDSGKQGAKKTPWFRVLLK